MNRFNQIVIGTFTTFAILFSTSIFAVAPDNPSFETGMAPWVVSDTGQQPGVGFIVSGDASDGTEFARLSFSAWIGSSYCGWSETGPLIQSSPFMAGTGETIALDWRNWGIDDEGIGQGFLKDAGTDAVVATFFDNSLTPICYYCDTGWLPASVVVPYDGTFYIEAQVASYDGTGGCLIGAWLDLDNVTSDNQAPDCSAAYASQDLLWPPNHKFKEISVMGVTDPDGDAITINIDSIRQDEMVNASDDGNTCPDAMGINTDTASVRAERVGGEIGYQGDGRMYWIYFTASDGTYGGTCDGHVKVGVPLDKDTPIGDSGPLYDSTPAVCP